MHNVQIDFCYKTKQKMFKNQNKYKAIKIVVLRRDLNAR
jgi:hypothetical protein